MLPPKLSLLPLHLLDLGVDVLSNNSEPTGQAMNSTWVLFMVPATVKPRLSSLFRLNRPRANVEPTSVPYLNKVQLLQCLPVRPPLTTFTTFFLSRPKG